MKKVEDEVLVNFLDSRYREDRLDREIRGIEMKEKVWFFDKKAHAFELRLVKEDGEPYLASIHVVRVKP